MGAILSHWTGHEKTPHREPAIEPRGEPDHVLDPKTLEELRGFGTSGVLEKVASLYLDKTPDLLKRLHEAARSSDCPLLATTAHSLKSSSGSIGALGLTACCRDLETAARGVLGGAPLPGVTPAQAIAAIEAEYDRVRSALTALTRAG